MQAFSLFPEHASSTAGEVDALYTFLVVVCTGMTILIFCAVFFFAMRYRRKDENDPAPKAIRGSLPLEIAWSVIPFLIMLGMFAWGTSKWPTMGPWNMGRGPYMVIAVLAIISMILIFVIGIQPPNQWALYITVGFVILTAIVWFAFENRRFQGPPVGDLIKRRQAEIAAIEAKFGSPAE